jgi:hypothetical protein
MRQAEAVIQADLWGVNAAELVIKGAPSTLFRALWRKQPKFVTTSPTLVSVG